MLVQDGENFDEQSLCRGTLRTVPRPAIEDKLAKVVGNVLTIGGNVRGLVEKAAEVENNRKRKRV